jgi:1-acyl-sn-glycerol-3-phosphate acyltransferase
VVEQSAGERAYDVPNLSDVKSMPTAWIWIARATLRTALKVRYDSHVHGADLVPERGPVLYVSNHIGYLDGPMLFTVSPRPVHIMVKESLYKGRLGRSLNRLGQIPVDRWHVDVQAVKRALRVLADGRVVAIYPEGVRGYGDVRRTRGGAAYLALVSGAPVVPVASLGTRTAGGDMNSMPAQGTRLDTVFGEAVRFDRVGWPRIKAQVASVQAEIQTLLARHVRMASEMTGQALPALPIRARQR